MHRMRVGLAAAAILLAATLAIFFSVKTSLEQTASNEVEARVARSEKLFQQLARLEGFDFANLASERAHRPSVIAISDQRDETERRRAAFTEAEALNAILQKDGRRADIVAILDAEGKVVARDLNANAMFGDDLKQQFPAVGRALRGEPTKDIWTFAGRMTRVALAPVAKPDGRVVGALLIGYVLSAKEARARRDLLGTDVAYFHAGKVQTSSFVAADGTGKEDANKIQALSSKLFQESKIVDDVLAKGVAQTQTMTLDGQEYLAVVSPISDNLADRTSGVVLLESLSAAKAEHASNATPVLILGLLAVFVALAGSVLTAKRFIKPLDHIELGVAEIINGNIDYTFSPEGPDFEGLSNGLNVMLARLLGRDEPSEDEVEDDEGAVRKWKAEQMVIEEGDGSPPTGVNAAALAQENEASYYPRLYNEYVAALRAAGRPAEGVSVPAFTAKLRLAEAGLRQKWKARLVRFALLNRGGELILRAIRLS